MTDITSARNIIQSEETRYRAPLSESTMTRTSAASNFLIKEQFNTYQFEYAGPFRPLFGGEGGTLTFINNQDIVGISGRLRKTGASGNTIIDCHYEQAGVDQGTIWSTQKLVIPSSTTEVGYFWVNFNPNNNSVPVSPTSDKSAAIILPTFDKYTFDQGDVLRLDVDDNSLGAQDLIINVWHRPRA